MPDYTGNLNLAKPIPNEDSADIRVINENMDKIDEWSTEINKKTKGATSEAAGIVKYGTDVSTALEGSKLAEILGIEYGGVLNNNNQKVAGKGYYDTANKKIYKCTTNTTINYADAGYFIEVSNNDLLGKLQNLIYYGSLGGNGTGVNRKITKLGIFHYCDSTTTNGEGETRLTLPEGWKVLFATTQERDNTNYGATKVWLRYYYGENYVTVRYVDAIASSTAFQCVIFAYKD